MHNILLKDLINICGGTLLIGDENVILDNFSIDSRTINEKDIFVGIKGESFDGGCKYIDALKK